MSQVLCKLPVAILALAGVVVAKWSLVKQLEVSKPAHPYTFFGAKTVATFIRLRADLLSGPLPSSLVFLFGVVLPIIGILFIFWQPLF